MNLAELAGKLGLTVPEGADETAIVEMIMKAFADLQASKKPDPTPAPPTDPVAASMVTQILMDNRNLKIDKLVSEAKIDPAEAAQWKQTYCKPALSLSALATDGFDGALTIAASRKPYMQPGEKTGSQSRTALDDTNPLLKDAKQRAGVK